MEENKLVDLSFEFAKVIVSLVDNIKTTKSSYMVDQLARAGTSVGANIHEAQYAHIKTDKSFGLSVLYIRMMGLDPNR